jgi:mannose-6-phosphate isomerase-like protein (cupin superfamily)
MVDMVDVAWPPAITYCPLWGGDETPIYPDDGSEPESSTFFPPVGGFRFSYHIVPPDGSVAPPDTRDMTPAEIEAAIAQAEAKRAGLAETMEPDGSGFHRSDTLDIIFILSGSVILELDDGETVTLRAGDTLVQNGTRHAWRNPGPEACRWVAMLIGAHRKP